VWWTTSYSPKINPGVTAIVLTTEGKTAYDRNKVGLANGSTIDLARRNCTPEGVPRVMAAPYPVEIAQTSSQTMFRFEVNGTTRTVTMDRPLPPAAELTSSDMGQSFGHWQGDTLIVESAGFNDKTFLDATGLPHSDQLRVTEHFWKSDGGRKLQYVALVVDPKTFTQIWAQRLNYDLRPDLRIANYACRGANRNISNIRGAGDWK
jgi:hypothetical protein